MRILAVRGKDLTSLAGEFDVNFETEPLASAGIFAITGPTGAGKSTLLDAVCLALFNHVPRLASASAGQVGMSGGEMLSASDPRALLRHRAGDGYAEVDFIGLDGARYRARWSVRRARNRPDGALQNVTQTFSNLDTGEALGGTRSETLAEIRSRIGLTAHQFGRAVMLAQGEFNAFIDADSNTRAELLEKLTGTELYARLGLAARQRADGLREGLVAIEARITAQHGLDDIARGEAEQRLAETRKQHGVATSIVAAREKDRNWHVRAGELTHLAGNAEQARTAAVGRRADAEPRRSALARRRLAYALVPAWQASADGDAKLKETSVRIVELAAAAEAAHERATQTAAADGGAAEALASAEAERERRRPELEQARALDQRLADLREALIPLEVVRTAATLQAAASEQAHREAVADRDAAIVRHGHLAEWMKGNRSLEGLSARRDDVAADIADYTDLAARVTALEEVRRSIVNRLAAARAFRSETEAGAVAARERVTEATRFAAETAARVPGADAAAAVERSRDALLSVEPQLLAFERVVADQERLMVADSAARAELARLKGVLGKSAARLNEIDVALPPLSVRRQEAARTSALSAAASDDAAGRLRMTLVDGEPCPVCGAADHVISALAGLIDGRAVADAQRVTDFVTEIDGLERERAVLIDRIEGDGERLDTASSGLAGGANANSAAVDGRERALAALGTVLGACGLDVGTDPSEMRADVSSRLEAIGAQRARFSASREAAALAARSLDEARTASEEAADIDRAAALSVSDLENEETSNAERLSDLTQRRDLVAGELDTGLLAYFDWRDDRSPTSTLDQLVSEWRTHAQGLATEDAELPALTSTAHEADIVLRRDAGNFEVAQRAERACLVDRDRVAADRALRLAGEAVSIVAGRLDELVRTAAARREAARLANDEARGASAAAGARHEQALRTLAVDQTEAERRRQTLMAECEGRGVEIAEIVDAVGAGVDALDEEARFLEGLELTVAGAEAEWRSRVADRNAHVATASPALNAEELDAALGAARVAEAAARETLTEAEMVIRQDDRARAATAELRALIEQARADAAPWLQLDTLIGDTTGNKFRRYAQGLTLERLLLHANARLAELKPRYALERAPGGEMLIQVIDNDMAGEVRGLPNLSGGERFLVSLALALGLSEMSTGQGLRVESLFIDEGFGALDSASLGQAISVLEHLHATGRRVGVISHIEDVKERIAVKIAVAPASNGRSSIEVIEG